MKKVIIIALIIIVAIILSYVVLNSNKNIDKILSEYEEHEIDYYYDENNNEQIMGYIVSNKTEQGYRYGYINNKGKTLLKAEYNSIYRVNEIKDDIYLISAKNGRYGINLNGKDIINYEYQFIGYNGSIEGFILQKSENYGVVNLKGEIIVPVQNEFVEVKGNYIYVTEQEGNKVYDKNGKEQQIDFNITIIPTENEKYNIKVDENYLYGVIDKNENELIETQYSYIEYLFDDYFIASDREHNQGIIDSNNNIKLELKYTSVQEIKNTQLIRTLNNKTNETEIYTKNFEKICTMTNANIENNGNKLKIYNENETKYFDQNGNKIKK